MTMRAWLVAVVALTTASCALRFGSARSEEMRVVLATAVGAAPAGAVGAWLLELDAQVAFVAAYEDSAWFRSAIEAARLSPSYIALSEGGSSFGLAIAAWEAIADTTGFMYAGLTRPLLHGAHYETPRGRKLDLIVMDVPEGSDPADVVQGFMTDLARRVDHDAIVMLALRAPQRPLADSIGVLLEPAFAGVARCEDQHDMLAAIQPGALRLYYSPATRVRCDAVRGFESPFPTLLARVELNG